MIRLKWNCVTCALVCAPLLACLLFSAGCPTTPPEPPASAVLAGDWASTTVEDADAFVRFNADGVVTRVFAITGDGSTLDVNVMGASTTLEGSTVTIVIPINDVTATFAGTLSADQNTMTGTLTGEITIGEDIVATIPAGDVTLTRIECLADEDCPAGEVCNDDWLCGEETAPGPAETLPTSLHDANARGMETFYKAENGGIELLTGVPYGDDRLDCHVCHDKSRWENADPPVAWPGSESCENCHVDPADPSQPVDEQICRGCHSRQVAESNLLDDVHRDAGFGCMSCHTAAEMHGDGVVYDSLLESPSPQCEDCHNETAGTLPDNFAHGLHGETMDCSSCHVQSVITCYSCHFDSQLAGAGKRHYGAKTGYKMLLRRDGKISAGTFMTLVNEQQSFYVIAPYYAHSVTDSPQCDDCHSSAATAEYAETGNITVAAWDEVGATLVGPTGVIPVPPDWETALLFDFLDYTGDPTTPISQTDPALWEFLKTGADLTQMLYAEPLTADQMEALGG